MGEIGEFVKKEKKDLISNILSHGINLGETKRKSFFYFSVCLE